MNNINNNDFYKIFEIYNDKELNINNVETNILCKMSVLFDKCSIIINNLIDLLPIIHCIDKLYIIYNDIIKYYKKLNTYLEHYLNIIYGINVNNK
jgi:hypothetical protein